MSVMVEIRHLRKEYRELVAVKDLSLQLDRGDIFGFIGPNGAGKTTTIKMLATLVTPTAGTAIIDGTDVLREPDRIRSMVGYMPDFFGVYDDIKVWEYLDFFASAYRIPRDRRPQIIDDVLGLTDLTIKKDTYVESLSRGMKQRLCLAKTLVHDPKVMLLDEPASGLDPRARIEIRELLLELQAMGKTIIVSSHILPEMEEFCNKIGIIERGELIVAGDVNTIARQVRGHQVVELGLVEAPGRAEEILAQMTDLVTDVKLKSGFRSGVSGTYLEPACVVSSQAGPVGAAGDTADVRHGGRVAAGAAAEREAPQTLRHLDSASGGCVLQFAYIGEPNQEHVVLTTLVNSGVKVRSFHTPETDLEDVFLSVTKGQVA